MAYESGILTGKDQSRIQRWALAYHKYAERKDQSEQFSEIRKLLHFILRGTSSKLYDVAYPSAEADDPDLIPGHTYGVDDLEGLEKLLSKIDRVATKTQASLNGNEWSDWG